MYIYIYIEYTHTLIYIYCICTHNYNVMWSISIHTPNISRWLHQHPENHHHRLFPWIPLCSCQSLRSEWGRHCTSPGCWWCHCTPSDSGPPGWCRWLSETPGKPHWRPGRWTERWVVPEDRKADRWRRAWQWGVCVCVSSETVSGGKKSTA